MIDLFAWMLEHQNLTWCLFLAPLFICMLRFAVLEGRQPTLLKSSLPSYSWVFVCGLIPVVNLVIATLCVIVTLVEVYRRLL